MPADIRAEQVVNIGEETVIECPSPSATFAVVFEDDGETGYFYGLDMTRPDNPICDALHLYNVVSVTDRHLPSTVQIAWSDDGLKAALIINRYPHAVFDFAARRGYCRTNFPPPSDWTTFSHEWSDSAIELFR